MARGGGRTRNKGAEQRAQLGTYWLWYRADRDDWAICWLDGRTTRRKSLGIGGGSRNNPPEEAQTALAEHFLTREPPADGSLPPDAVLVDDITRRWLSEHVAHLDAPERYATSVLIWESFYQHMRREGRMPDPYTVASVRPSFVRDFIRFRIDQDVSPPSISRDLKALRGPINWALGEGILAAAPKIPDVKGKGRRRELEYSPQQIAAILEAAASSPYRRHLLLYMMIFLSTNGRSEAILELDADTQIKKGLIYFNAPGREQTRKRRFVVPIAPTLAPWLEGLRGKAIRYRVDTTAETRANGGPDFFEYETSDVGRAFESCLIEAGTKHSELGLCRQATDADDKPI